MERSVALKIAAIQEAAANDPRYLALWAEYRELNPRLLHLLENMSQEEVSVVEDYLGLTAEMHRFLLELACK